MNSGQKPFFFLSLCDASGILTVVIRKLSATFKKTNHAIYEKKILQVRKICWEVSVLGGTELYRHIEYKACPCPEVETFSAHFFDNLLPSLIKCGPPALLARV